MNGGDTTVLIPNHVRKVIQEVKKFIESKHSEEFVYTTLKDCDMDPEEAGRRLKMIHDIREIAGKHNVEDVYTMLKDCNMDPNEAAQKLLYIDTFHEVKKKHDRRKSVSKFHSVRHSSSGKEYGATHRQERISRPTIPVHSGKENIAALVANSAVNGNGTLAMSNGSYSHKLEPESSSTSDTVVASKKTHHTCAIGTIQCEIVIRSGSTKSNSRLPDGIKISADSFPVIAESADSDNARQLKYGEVEKIQISESLKPLTLLNHDSSQAVKINQDNQSLQVLHEPLKVTASENSTKSITNTHSIPEEKSELKPSGQKPDVVLEKSTLSSQQPVIFPDHLQVPENFKNHFTFGSLDATLDDSQPLPVTSSPQQNDEIVPEPTLKDNISSDPPMKHEETKVDMMSGFQNPILHSDYSFGFMPHLMGPHFVHLDASGLGQSQTPTTQPATAGQNSIYLSPPVFPYFKQPFPTYIPYNPYFPHLYLPQNAHLLNHALFPHQPPPTAVKFPVPPQFKQVTNLGNLTPNQDLTVSQEKDNNNHPPAQQGEDQRIWGHANLLPNYFYNFPQGHHVAFSPLQAASHYHSSQPLIYQSQSTGGTVEKPKVPPQHAPPQVSLNRETG